MYESERMIVLHSFNFSSFGFLAEGGNCEENFHFHAGASSLLHFPFAVPTSKDFAKHRNYDNDIMNFYQRLRKLLNFSPLRNGTP